MDEYEKRYAAKEKVEALTGFYIHLTVFILVMLFLLAINVASGSDWWVQWPMIGWGVGILAHAFAVFSQKPNFITRWQDRKAEALKNKM